MPRALRRHVLACLSVAACACNSTPSAPVAPQDVVIHRALPSRCLSVMPLAAPAAWPRRGKSARVVARAGEGFLETQDGLPLLHLKGSPRERGRQYGVLMGDRIASVLVALDRYARKEASALPSWAFAGEPVLTRSCGEHYLDYVTPDVLEMLQGVADGAAQRQPPVELQLLDLMFINAIIDAAATVQAGFTTCSGLAVWGSRTREGKTYQLRNVDLTVGTGLESFAVVAVEKPEGKLAFANAGWAGMVGTASGLNEAGVALSQVWAFSRDAGLGEPWILTARRALEAARNVDVVPLFFAGTTRTYGSNFVFADRGDERCGEHAGIAMDSSQARLAVFGPNDEREDAAWGEVPLSIRMEEAVVRGDTPLDAQTFEHFYKKKDGEDPRERGGYKDRYRQPAALVQAYAEAGTKIGAEEMKAISRAIAMPSESLQCVVYENDDLVLHVANSRLERDGAVAMARDEPFHAVDLDYYLPTVSLDLDGAEAAAGAVLEVPVTVVNRGRSRHLEVGLRLVRPDALPAARVARIAVESPLGSERGARVAVEIPAGLAPGDWELVAELVEAGTADVVDYAARTVRVRR